MGAVQNRGLIGWDCGAIDAFLSLGKPVSAGITPANRDEREQVDTLLEQVEVQTGKPGRPAERVKRIIADKRYDSQALRESLQRKGIQPQIAQCRNAKVKPGRAVEKSAPRFQVERTFAYLQRKFRRLTVRGGD